MEIKKIEIVEEGYFDYILCNTEWNSINFKLNDSICNHIELNNNQNIICKYNIGDLWINLIIGLYNTSMVNIYILCKYLFERNGNIKKITICIWEEDFSGRELLLNCGFIQEVVLRKYINDNGIMRSLIIMSKFREY